MVNKGKMSDIRHLDFCKAFGMVPYSILDWRDMNSKGGISGG